MKLKRILSSALAFLMIFTAVVAAVPVTAEAAYENDSTALNLTSDEIKAIVNGALEYNFSTAEEMLAYELALGYLDAVHTQDKKFSMYVNRYTGVLYYVNNVTGQILTSNPYNPAYTAAGSNAPEVTSVNRELLMSQISINYIVNSTNKEAEPLNSTKWAALYTQISTDFINGGIRVNYTLGDTTSRFLLPGRILAEDYEALVLVPMLERFEGLLIAHLTEYDSETNFSFFDNEKYEAYEYGCINSKALNSYLADMLALAKKHIYKTSEEDEIKALRNDITAFVVEYSLKNPAKYEETGDTDSAVYQRMIKSYYTPDGNSDLDIYNENSEKYHAAMYVFKENAKVAEKRASSKRFQKYCSSYTFSQMLKDEKECGYVDNTEDKPVFRCALEYTFDDDGTLSVRLPASSISFDETVYTLSSIVPLQFFGAGQLDRDGYIFFPDGSGTVIDFDDFKDTAFTVPKASIYGNDYCYSYLIGSHAHREQISMPVYGVVNEVNANSVTASQYGVSTVTNGFFAILEEGASLASLAFAGGGNHKYASAYSLYTPYPSDTYDLSDTISVGGSASYTIVSDSKYNGSYVTKIVMLTDDTVGEAVYGKDAYYSSSYVGMASYYRDYLKSLGAFEALQNVSADLPLYIEALGAMDITAKVLSFPVTKTIPLTTFEDVLTMYKELYNNKETYIAKAAEYDKLAEETEDEALKEQYVATAAGYRTLSETAENINNINFRLTGFSNGGMHYTYPAKVRWEKACGGKRAFNDLLKEAQTASSAAGVNFGIYPDFDFMYINNTSTFDGISIKGNVSRMVDNRYASKQIYNSVLQEYVSYYTLVVNPSSFEKLYNKFIGNFTKYNVSGVSLSTMGSDLNSNFDDDEPVNRSDAEGYVTNVLNKIKNDNQLDIMVDQGNAYTYKYVSHILNASTDSSHYRYSSYAVPFVGMVLHGYVSYTGSPLNYSGTPAYDLLRSIENGAAPYYVLCYRNSQNLKNDPLLSEYYGVDYNTWFDSIVSTYGEMNALIGDLQTYNIVDHKVILGERVIEASETLANYESLKAEIIELLDAQIAAAIEEGFAYLKANEANPGRPLEISVDRAALIAQFADILGIEISAIENTLYKSEFAEQIDAVIAKYTAEYPAGGTNPYVVSFSSIDYTSKYSYLTDSLATDKNYVRTDYTSDINNIVMVTYSNGTDTVRFILNYNIYSVTVNLGEGNTYTLGKYECVRID